jgi:hypothetical protein
LKASSKRFGEKRPPDEPVVPGAGALLSLHKPAVKQYA